jgi:RNA polymerase sigma factor (sigma-70 family)
LECLTEIIKECVKQNPACQKAVYERYHGYALKIVFRYIYRHERALDVVNDGFVKLFANINVFRCEEEKDAEKLFMGWMKKIMINASIDELRKKNMLPEIGGIPDRIWQTADGHQHADHLLLYKDLIILIKNLPPPYRIVFNMYVIDGYSHNEIAGALGIPIGTSKSNLSRARILLKKSIREMEDPKACTI